MSDAEITTTTIVALDFGGNFEGDRLLLNSPLYSSQVSSKSQFNRRLHALLEMLLIIFCVLGETFNQLNALRFISPIAFQWRLATTSESTWISVVAASSFAAIPHA
jgi:hypothetical protein